MPFGPVELIVILVIALLILGPGKLPEVGASLGKSIREFRKASSDLQDSVKIDASPAPPVQSAQATPPPAVPPAPAPSVTTAPPETAATAPAPASDGAAAPAGSSTADAQPVATGSSASADPASRPE